MDAGRVHDEVDVVAPDGSEIRLLLSTGRGSMVHCTLPPACTSHAVHHRTVEEIWFVVQGFGQVWRSGEGKAETVPVSAGACLTIPTGTHFQFRNTGDEPLVVIIATMPPWPGAHEAVAVPGPWEGTAGQANDASGPPSLYT